MLSRRDDLFNKIENPDEIYIDSIYQSPVSQSEPDNDTNDTDRPFVIRKYHSMDTVRVVNILDLLDSNSETNSPETPISMSIYEQPNHQSNYQDQLDNGIIIDHTNLTENAAHDTHDTRANDNNNDNNDNNDNDNNDNDNNNNNNDNDNDDSSYNLQIDTHFTAKIGTLAILTAIFLFNA